jgi:putative redox protein
VNVRAKWQGKRRFTSVGKTGYEVTMDASPEWGGESRGNSPMELLLMALCGCMGIDVTMILERMRQKIEDLEIVAEGTRREGYPQGFARIDLTFVVNGDIPPAKVWRAIRLAEEKYCSVAASLNATLVPHLILNGEECPPPTVEADDQPADM